MRYMPSEQHTVKFSIHKFFIVDTQKVNKLIRDRKNAAGYSNSHGTHLKRGGKET